jgi:para-aminobenzoate synthetase component 1
VEAAEEQKSFGSFLQKRTSFLTSLEWRDPAGVFQIFQDLPFTLWLDSQGEGVRARYSYLCVAPFEVHDSGDPFAVLDGFLARFAGMASDAPVPFAGGAAGFLGYECATALERIPRHTMPGVPDFSIGFYDLVFAWDHAEKCLWLISTGLPETEPHARLLRASARRDFILHSLKESTAASTVPTLLVWRQDTSRALHEARVARAIAYVRAGDIFQANITARFSATRPAGLAAADIHLALRAANPAPYGAFLHARNGFAIASVSPERFVGVTNDGDIEARPIKGTSPRAATLELDAELAATLLSSRKDHSENLMIVDLLRNDIGRVARFGSVHVPELAQLETFAHVHHLVSSVRATLRTDASAADLLRATFPGGSITGAPKIRAIEIIHELEQTARGPYCGSIFWMGHDGGMDSSILIRTATITKHEVIVQAGGGIVADSDPGAEYEEMFLKARPLLAALGELPE